MTILKVGSKGPLVAAVQCITGMPPKNVDGKYGEATKRCVIAHQNVLGIASNGIVDAATWTAMQAALPTLRPGDRGACVRAVEGLLNLDLDGIYAEAEVARVKTYQATQALDSDGIVGPVTWSALLALKASAPPVLSAARKRPKDYKQYDGKWGSKVYSSTGNKNQTMRSSGCGPTAAADVVASVCDPNVTPWTLAQLCLKWGYRTANSGTAWGAFKRLFEHYAGFAKFVQTGSHATAIAALGQGALIVASMGPGFWTRAGHFICLWQCDGSAMYACDPASGARKKQKLDVFKQQVKQYFIFWPR